MKLVKSFERFLSLPLQPSHFHPLSSSLTSQIPERTYMQYLRLGFKLQNWLFLSLLPQFDKCFLRIYQYYVQGWALWETKMPKPFLCPPHKLSSLGHRGQNMMHAVKAVQGLEHCKKRGCSFLTRALGELSWGGTTELSPKGQVIAHMKWHLDGVLHLTKCF